MGIYFLLIGESINCDMDSFSFGSNCDMDSLLLLLFKTSFTLAEELKF